MDLATQKKLAMMGHALYREVMEADPKELPPRVRMVRAGIELTQNAALEMVDESATVTKISWVVGMPFVLAWLVCVLMAVPLIIARFTLSVVVTVLDLFIIRFGRTGLWFVSLAEYETEEK